MITDTAAGAILAQYVKQSRKEQDLYYANQELNIYEQWYMTLEKSYLSLEWVTQKLRHYMVAFEIKLISQWIV